jgi:hypothetical protein
LAKACLLLSANYIASVGGGFHLFYGTSASTPTVASIFTLLNDQRITVGKSTLGFINPFLVSFSGIYTLEIPRNVSRCFSTLTRGLSTISHPVEIKAAAPRVTLPFQDG